MSALVRLLPILAIVGLVMAPLGASAAPGMTHAAMAAGEAMPCCPPEAPACDKACTCPVLCPSQSVQQMSPAAQSALPPLVVLGLIVSADDLQRRDLAAAPIPTPPRT